MTMATKVSQKHGSFVCAGATGILLAALVRQVKSGAFSG